MYPFEHLWFLQAIFLIFLVFGLLDATGRLDRLGTWGLALGVACALCVLLLLPDEGNLFSANGALRLLPFFLLAVGLRRFGAILDRQSWLAWTLPVFTVVYGVRLLSVLGNVQPAGALDRGLGLAVGLAGMVSIFLLRGLVKSRALAWIGGFSFGIYLLHVFTAAATRVVAQRAGVDSDLVLFALGLAAGVGLPIAFELTAGRVPMISRLILGRSPPSTPRASSPSTPRVPVSAVPLPG